MDLHDKFKGPQINRPYRTEMFMATYAVNPDSHLDHTQNTGKKKKSPKYATKGRAWTRQHCSVGIRVCKYFVGEMAAPTLHANSVRDHGRNRHARSVEENVENVDVEIKTEVDMSGKQVTPNPATASASAEESATAALSTKTSTDKVSRQEPLFHIFVSSTSENVVTSTADSAISSVDVTTVQDKPRTSAVVSTAPPSAQRASKRAAIVLDQPPRKVQNAEEQKAKQRQLNIEKQAAAKRQLQSISGSSASNGKAAGTDESATSFSVIKKKKTSIVEDTESAISHHRSDQNHSRSSSNSSSWPIGSRGDSSDIYGRRDGWDSGNSGSNSRTSYSRYEAPSQGHSTTLYDTRRPVSSNTLSTSSVSTANANPIRMTETLSLAPPETSNNTGNIKVVHFIDQCLAIMKRHQQHMISARQRVLQAYSPVGNEFSNNLVESLAADIVQIIGPPTPPEVAPPVKLETSALQR